MPAPQTYRNHTRWFPPFHFFVGPVLILNFIFVIAVTIHHWPEHRAIFGWDCVVSFTLVVLAVCSRVMALAAQDRVIRLEERLRFAALLPPDLHARSQALTVRQIVGLRFASDAELPPLVKRALDENLSEKQIKQAINTWRPDTCRV